MEGYERIVIAQRDKINISVVVHECGKQVCQPGQRVMPGWSDAFSLYYVVEGKGLLRWGQRGISVEANTAFLIHSEAPYDLEADGEAPWSLLWVVFSGYLVRDYMRRAGFTKENPVFPYPQEPFFREQYEAMFRYAHSWHNRYCKILSSLYALIARHIDMTATHYNIYEKYGNDFTMRRALEYIDQHYAQPDMRIEDIAQYVGLSRTRFHHVFREMAKMSPQQYLIHHRMRRAAELLKLHNATVSELARNVGYTDPFHFSKTFKQIHGVSPTRYARQITMTPEALQDYRIQMGIMQARILELEAENRELHEKVNQSKPQE
ncbi:MAG TPA: AraC family transcriptional regulator [Clostridia bacterium]|nr:AraC family transcriptional regulator [Clostridia bacterium]